MSCAVISFAQSSDDSIAQLQEQSTTLGLLSEALHKNMYGVNQYATAAAILSKEAVIKFGHGSECNTSCPDGCCASGDSLLLESALYTLMTDKANSQISFFIRSASGACDSYNKASPPSQKDCGKEVTSMSTFMPQPSWYDDNGACKAGAPPECAFIEQFTLGDQFKSSSQSVCGAYKNEPCGGIKSYFKAVQFNKDGSINFKFNGVSKRISISDFENPVKLKSMGFSEKVIGRISNEFKALNQQVFKNNYAPSIPSFVPGNIQGLAEASMAAQDVQTKLGAVQADRSPSGLTKDQLSKHLGEDPIGFSEQNIFKMINMRYQSELNSFEEKE